jgi:hypothetical protein
MARIRISNRAKMALRRPGGHDAPGMASTREECRGMIKYIVGKTGDYVRVTCDRCRRRVDIPIALLTRRFAPQGDILKQASDHIVSKGWSSEPGRGDFCQQCARKHAPAGRRGSEEGGDGQ